MSRQTSTRPKNMDKLSIKQQLQIISSYPHSIQLPLTSEIKTQYQHLKQFKQKIIKQIQKQDLEKISNQKIIKNLEAQIKQLTKIQSTRTLIDVETERKKVEEQIIQIKAEIRLFNIKGVSRPKQVGTINDSNTSEYQYQLEVKKNAQYKKKLQDLERTNEHMKSLPPVNTSSSKTKSRQKKPLQLLESLSIVKAKAQKSEKVYLGNISSKQSKMMNLQKSSLNLDKSISQIQQQIQEMKLLEV